MPSEFKADLHCHTNCSDGTDSPEEILHLAKKAGLSGLSITDHDTIRAYTPDLFKIAEKIGLRLLSGAEISSEIDQIPVHILAYGIDIESRSFHTFLETMQKRREKRNLAILEKLKAKKMPISYDELKAFAHERTIGRPHIAQIMVEKGYVSSFRDAFELYLKEGACCFSSGIKFTPPEVIEEIHKAKGKAVLAHPHFYKGKNFIKKLLAFAFDGYECYYSRLDPSQEKPWIKRAEEKGLIITGGSDYHGKLKPFITLGASWVGLETFELLSEAKP